MLVVAAADSRRSLRFKPGPPAASPVPMSYIDIASVATHCAGQIGLDQLSDAEESPFPLMSEMIDTKKECNFFEPRGSECQGGGCLKRE